MAAIAGSIKGVRLLNEPVAGAGRHVAEVFVTFGAYTASSDTVIVSSVATYIQNCRRDGKTATLKTVGEGQCGRQGSTSFFLDTLSISTNDVTGELSNEDGTEIDAASGVADRACSFLVSYKLA